MNVFLGSALLVVSQAVTSQTGAWVAGGDSDVSWTATASSQYYGCSGYDLCNYDYAVDGTSADGGSEGKILALNGNNYVS